MPNEVVFVDTPGLKDPVKYRSDITKSYIKRADAVLIAAQTTAFNSDILKVITTTLDYVDSKKAYIVATQKDLYDTEDICENIVSLWAENLVNAKRFDNIRSARSRIILTSAKMDLLFNKWISLTDEERADDKEVYFSYEDYNSLTKFVNCIVRQREYSLIGLPYDEEVCSKVVSSTGIKGLKDRLNKTLIDNYRLMLVEELEKLYLRCKQRIIEINTNTINQQLNYIDLAKRGEEELCKKLEEYRREKEDLRRETDKIKKESEVLIKDIDNIINSLS